MVLGPCRTNAPSPENGFNGTLLDIARAAYAPKYLGAMSVGEIAQITAAFVVVLAPLNWLVDNCSGLADCLSSANRVAISFGVRGRLSRFRSYRTVRHRRTFAV